MHLRAWVRAVAITSAAAVIIVPLWIRTDAHAAATDAPGAPGAAATWRNGDKDGVGTSVTRDSKVWYTLTDGTLSETYYPAADTPNVRDLGFVVSDGSTFSQRETDDTTRRVELADKTSLTYRQITTDNQQRWRITKTYVTDPARATVVINVSFESLSGAPYELYALYDPSLAGTAADDSGSTVTNGASAALVASDTHLADRPVATALVSSSGFIATSTGYAGASDGWTDLGADHHMDWNFPNAGPGNIVQTGQIPTPTTTTNFTLALGFGPDTATALTTANATLATSYGAVSRAYQRGWKDYLAKLKPVPKQLTGDMATQYNVSVMTVKAHEDKTFPGAFIASLTLPWGQVVSADGSGGGGSGYHFVWARDLYQQATALIAAGDTAAATRAVDWLFTHQQQADGHFPQNSHVDGTPDQTNVQLDETAFPIILAGQVGRTGRAFYLDHIRKAADFLVATGPKTPQERWETEGGYSPSTIAAEIAGLTVAADIARKNNDEAAAAIYQGTADSWQRQTEKWMYTTTGPVGDGKYYIRIEGNGDPNDNETREYSDGAGVLPEKSVLDAGFLDLVRLGVKAPNDPYVAGSIPETDASLATDTPSGRMWHRYTHDGFGEHADGSPWSFPDHADGTGRLWPLLSGERGEYELANGRNAFSYLQTMHNAANAGFMIPEQAWDVSDPTSFGHVFGKGTGSAAPLSWAMAQYVRLAQGIAKGSPVETPPVVANRYANPGQKLTPPALTVTSPSAALETVNGRTINVTGTTSGTRVFIDVNGTRQAAKLSGTSFTASVNLPDLRNNVTVVAVSRSGATAAEVRTVLSFGERIGGLADPTGDDNGPGTYTYPTNPVYVPGTFDLTGFDVFSDGDNYVLVTSIAAPIDNPFGGDQISHQKVNVYLGSASATGPSAALPGTNMNTATGWDHVVVVDGRFDQAGVYGTAGTKQAAISLVAIPETRQIAAVVPKAALGVIDAATTRFGVAMFGNAEAGEGLGDIRPVYDPTYWATNPLGFVRDFRFGGGAGELDSSLPSQDTDTRDPNAIDIIVGAGQDQATVMDWQASNPVALPMVPLG
jgi:glucan 1,4-alpha-glucosidase